LASASPASAGGVAGSSKTSAFNDQARRERAFSLLAVCVDEARRAIMTWLSSKSFSVWMSPGSSAGIGVGE
jgi:hypothetical protein